MNAVQGVTDFIDHASPLLFIHPFGRRCQLHVISGFFSNVNQRCRVLPETGSTISWPGVQELGTNPFIEPHGLGHGLHVGIHQFTQVGHFVDKGNLGGQEHVRRVFNHFCRWNIRHDKWRFNEIQRPI